MTKILNFALKIKGGGREGGTCEVLRPGHPPKFGTCTNTVIDKCVFSIRTGRYSNDLKVVGSVKFIKTKGLREAWGPGI